MIVKTYGPPGTGKTTRLIERVMQIKDRTPLKRVAYLSFSRAARDVIRERLNVNEKIDLQWVRTIHGAATRELGLNGAIVNWRHYIEFSSLTGMKISPEDIDDDVKALDFNVTLRAYNLAQTMMVSPREVMRMLPDHINLTDKRYEAFVEAWTKFKKDRGLHDFTDMLLKYHAEGEPLPVDEALLDEAQDLSKLQWACFEKMVRNARNIYMAGDDDQTVFTFIGADEYGFLEHPCDEEEVLTKSYRVPASIGEQADAIIARIAHRKEKHVVWRDAPGSIMRINRDALGMNWREWQRQYKDIMVLCRHRKGATRFSDDLKLAGVTHSLNGETMDAWPEAKVLHSLYRLKDGKSITPAAAFLLADALNKDTTKYREMRQRDEVTEIEGVNVHSLDWLAEFARTKRSRMRYLALNRVIKYEGYEAVLKKPKITVSTMHAAKGKEAELVVIVPDCTNIVKKNAGTPTEIRLSYVALTRALRDVALVIPRTDTYIQHFFQ